jgi:hypothetical protein
MGNYGRHGNQKLRDMLVGDGADHRGLESRKIAGVAASVLESGGGHATGDRI